MVLVIGGANQGKRKCSWEILGITQEEYQQKLADGYHASAQKALHSKYIAAYHVFLQKVMEEGGDPDSYTRQVLDGKPEIISMDEIGYGIVPIEERDRMYREAVGRSGQMLAAEAKNVFRVVCGIPIVLK